jgi:hypothetical protein
MTTTLIAGPGKAPSVATRSLVFEHLAAVGEDSTFVVVGNTNPDLGPEFLAALDYASAESALTYLLTMGPEDYLLLAWRDDDAEALDLLKRAAEREVTVLDLSDGLLELQWEDDPPTDDETLERLDLVTPPSGQLDESVVFVDVAAPTTLYTSFVEGTVEGSSLATGLTVVAEEDQSFELPEDEAAQEEEIDGRVWVIAEHLDWLLDLLADRVAERLRA